MAVRKKPEGFLLLNRSILHPLGRLWSQLGRRVFINIHSMCSDSFVSHSGWGFPDFPNLYQMNTFNGIMNKPLANNFFPFHFSEESMIRYVIPQVYDEIQIYMIDQKLNEHCHSKLQGCLQHMETHSFFFFFLKNSLPLYKVLQYLRSFLVYYFLDSLHALSRRRPISQLILKSVIWSKDL